LNPFKINGRFKFEFVPEFEILREIEVGPKRKVVPYVLNYCPTKIW
jgi:hypothetical protein